MSGSGAENTVVLPITGSCHCGAVSYEVKVAPRFAISCNCSMCRRLGTVWGHGEVGDAKIICQPGAIPMVRKTWNFTPARPAAQPLIGKQFPVIARAGLPSTFN